MRPARMPSRFDEAAETVRPWLRPEDRPLYDRTLAFRPRYEAWVRELTRSPVPHSVDHNDLHPANLLVPPKGGTEATRFYDWGDAVVAHPFASMLHGLGWIPSALGVTERGPELRRLRDAYLGPFAAFGSREELQRTLELACRVAKVGRCLSWSRAIAMGDAATGFERAPVELFGGIPDESYLSRV